MFANDLAVKKALGLANKVLVPAIVLGELYYGAYNSGRVEQNVNEIQLLSKQAEVIDINSHTAKYYGEIKNQLKRKENLYPKMIFG